MLCRVLAPDRKFWAAHGAYIFPEVGDIVELDDKCWRIEAKVGNIEPIAEDEARSTKKTRDVPEMKPSPSAHNPSDKAKTQEEEIQEEQLEKELDASMPEAPVLGGKRKSSAGKNTKKVGVKKG